MAQEIHGTVTLNITLSNQTASGTTNFTGDLVGDFLGDEQTVAITSTPLEIGDITAFRVLYVRNLDTTNYVEIDAVTGFTGFPQKIRPGDAAMLFPQTSTLYAKANTAPVKIWIVAG